MPLEKIKSLAPEVEYPLIDYVEKMIRKSKKDKKKLKKLLKEDEDEQ